MQQAGHTTTDLSDKIKQVLMEARMVLPGVQALLGFQLICVFSDSFERLSFAAKILHLASLSTIGVCTVLLLAPVSYHRIVEKGEDSEQFHQFAGRLLLWAMVFLGLGAAGDFAVVLHKISGSWPIAGGIGSAAAAVCFTLWFGYTSWTRERWRGLGENRKAA